MTQLTIAPLQPPRPTSNGHFLSGAPDPRLPLATKETTLGPEQLLRAVRRRWWAIVLGGTIGAGGALAWAFASGPAYLGTALVQLAPARENLTEGLAGRDGNTGDRSAALLGLPPVDMIRGRAVVGAVVDSEPLGLRVIAEGFPSTSLRDVALAPDAGTGFSIPLTFTPVGVIVAGRPPAVPYGQGITVGPLRFVVGARPELRAVRSTSGIAVRPRDATVKQVSTRLLVRARGQSSLTEINYASPDPGLARRVVNRAALAFQAIAAQSVQQQVRRRRAFIEEQIARVDSQTTAAAAALSGFRTRVQAFSAAEKFTGQERDLLDLQTKERDLRTSRQAAQRLLDQFESNEPGVRAGASRMLGSTSGLSTNPVTAALVTKLAGYEAQRIELTSGPGGYTTAHPDVIREDALIAATEAALINSLRSQASVLDLQLRDVEAQRVARERELSLLPGANAEESQLLQNLTVLRDQGTVLRGEFQKARIAEAVAVGPVEIVELESHPTSVPRTDARVIIVATLLGLGLGAVAAVAPALFEGGLRRRVDVEGALGLPVLATVSRLEHALAPQRPWRAALAHDTDRMHADTARRRAVALATLDVDTQPGAEAYRRLRAALFSTRYSAAPRCLLVTSAGACEGKTSVAVNLATSLAQQGQRVLLIDGDMRDAKLHRILNLSLVPGFSDVLLGRNEPTDGVVQQGAIGGLFVLTAGAPSLAASDLLGTHRMRVVLNDYIRAFDAVIIDSSPVLAVADATVLGAQVDAVLVVVRAGQTTAAELGEAVRQLTQAGASLAGAVFNDPDGKAEDERRAGYYSYATSMAQP